MVKESLIDYKLSEILVEEKGFDLLSMGQGEGPGCYCYPNTIVRNYIEKLASNYKYVVIDNEAGWSIYQGGQMEISIHFFWYPILP